MTKAFGAVNDISEWHRAREGSLRVCVHLVVRKRLLVGLLLCLTSRVFVSLSRDLLVSVRGPPPSALLFVLVLEALESLVVKATVGTDDCPVVGMDVTAVVLGRRSTLRARHSVGRVESL